VPPPGAPVAEAVSLRGDTLYRPALPPETETRLRADFDSAVAELQRRPHDPNAWIWAGRRATYLGAYNHAITIYTLALERFPDEPRLYRHRGHRYTTVRQFDSAIADLRRAAQLMAGRPDEVEPDGQPNARNIPIGSLQSNVWYHLALAHYLKGEWDASIAAARRGLEVASNPDRLVSQTHWLYMALRRAGRDEEARAALTPIRDDLDIIENDSYHRLLLLYRDGVPAAQIDSLFLPQELTPSNAAMAYGLANWLLYAGDTTRAIAAFEQILSSPQWASFGYIAAEAGVARINMRAAEVGTAGVSHPEPVFESGIWPGEGIPVVTATSDSLVLRRAPRLGAEIVARLTVQPGTELPYDSTRFQTIVPGELTVRAVATLHGRWFGNITYLPRSRYYSNQGRDTSIVIEPGADIQYLQYRAEGTCFVRLNGHIIDAGYCPTVDTAAYRLERQPVTHWWIYVRAPGGSGWLRLEETVAAVVDRRF